MSENVPAVNGNEVSTDVITREVTVVDNGKPTLYNPAATAQLWRTAKLFASSDLVPASYKDKPENCFIAMEMAERMNIAPFAMLQNLVIIKGKPSMEAKLITALVNNSGMFVDPIEYEIVGDDPYADDYKVRAFAVRAKTGKLCQGPWITYKMVKGEGWYTKDGSKWKTMPELMFMYRAASYFAKVFCSNITMGMPTREEVEDIEIEEVRESAEVTRERFAERREEPVPTQDNIYGAAPGYEPPVDNGTPPTRKRGEPSPGKQRRTKTEMEEDAEADRLDALAAAGQTDTGAADAAGAGDAAGVEDAQVIEDNTQPAAADPEDESDWPDQPGATQQTEPAEPTAQPQTTPAGGGLQLF